tara:strand:- start:576 stop:740 length:165 start_codon:yes stop_codon:yes gene_type:complete
MDFLLVKDKENCILAPRKGLPKIFSPISSSSSSSIYYSALRKIAAFFGIIDILL